MIARVYARALRFVAAAIVVVVIARQLTDTGRPPEIAQSLLALRGSVVAVAALIGLLCTPTRSIPQLRALAFILGLSAGLTTLGVIVVVPAAVWEQFGVLVAIVLGAAVFMPWSERWQGVFAATLWTAAAVALTGLISAPELPRADAARFLLSYAVMGATSVVGAYLTDSARRAVAASEARYRGLFEGAGEAIAVLDEGGVIREANPRLAALLGRPLETIVGRQLGDFCHIPPAPGERATQAHAVALGGDPQQVCQTLRRADGTPVEVDVTLARVVDPEQARFVLAILRDFTGRRATERRQVQEQRLDSLARFAGGIAHQFNNLLGGILTHASLLRADAANRASAAELDEILAAARRGRDLTTELLRLTRHEAITLKPTAPAALLESVATLARASIPEEVTIEVTVPAGVPALAGDADHLVPACLQLVLNARDAMAGRPGSRLTLAAVPEDVAPGGQRWPGAAPGRYVRISVTDNGAGMDATTVERLFEPFFSTKPMHQAAGLGLAAVHSVVRDHHGAVRVESAPGQGTTVHLLIPVAEPAPAAAATATATAPAPVPPAQATILVVDDEEIVRNSLKRALTRFGYRVLEAADGGTALAQLQSAQPPVDLVILDLVLPGGGAGIFEVLKAIRPDLKVLVSSGYNPDAENAKALAAKAQGFLSKPYEIAELREAVAKALTEPAPALPRP